MNARRDRWAKTPPFRLSQRDHLRLGEVEATCRQYGIDPSASIELELKIMHQEWLYRHRPIVGLANSLNAAGDLAFDRDWEAHRAENMGEAWAEFRASTLDERRAA